MKRLFDEHYLRDEISLDGFWEFVKDDKNVGSAERWEKHFPKESEIMPVPGCWDTKTEHFDYDGIGWYRKIIYLKKKGTALFNFEGVSGIAEVFLDGIKLGKHNGSYTPFSFLKKSVPAGNHELIVKVDNFQHPGKVIPDYSDWHLYGGIFRSVNLQILNNVWIKTSKIDYSINKSKVNLTVVVNIKNLLNTKAKDILYIDLNNEEIDSFPLELEPNEEIHISYKLGELELSLWAPKNPNLHLIKIKYAGDDLQDRIGFRDIKCKKNGIIINGVLEKIRGINRHHEYGDSGFTVPPEITIKDFEIIKEMGCNAVRSHYPIDQYAMDICDELGLLFWAEIPFWGRWSSGVVAQKTYLKLAEKHLTEMIDSQYNHPAIFTWSVLNECATNTSGGVYAVERLTEYARKLDSSRPVTLATHHPTTDLTYKYLDFIGVNSYPGWYSRKAFNDGTIAEWSHIIPAMQRNLKINKLKDTPIVITETGAGAVYGDRGLEDRRWSENTQCRIVKKSIEYALDSDDVMGIFIWQFCDIRCQSRDWERRPGTFNNKGVLDRFRRPKMAYYMIKELYSF